MNAPWVRGALSAGLLAVLAGCSSYGDPINGQKALSPEEMRLQAVENKTVDLERRVNGIESNRVGAQLADEVRGLHGQVEEVSHQNEELRQQIDALNQRLQKLEALAAGTQAPSPDPGASGEVAPGPNGPPIPLAAAPVFPPPPAASAAQEQTLYNANFGLLKLKHYDDAIRGFRAQLDQYPQGSFADNAWYWMGEAQYVKGDSAAALKSFQTCTDRFPNSPKAPDALLETGLINLNANNTVAAKVALMRIVKDFPTSKAADTARTKLAQLH